MLYVEIRKKFEVRRGKFFISLPSAQKNTRQTRLFAECKKKTLGKELVCRVFSKFTVLFFLPECVIFDTRQMACLSSVRWNALVKPLTTRQMRVFPQCACAAWQVFIELQTEEIVTNVFCQLVNNQWREMHADFTASSGGWLQRVHEDNDAFCCARYMCRALGCFGFLLVRWRAHVNRISLN